MFGLPRVRPWMWAVLSGVTIVGIYGASIAATGPWDPWETHYGEVARQINMRRDPLDLWWQPGNGGPDGRDERTFWSKPALAFWLMALSMQIFGVGFGRDPAEMLDTPWPELAIRMPSLLMGLLTIGLLAYLVWRLVGPRAGILTGVVLATMPQWALVTRQALTDMFFVGPVVWALCAWALAWLQPDRPLRRRGTGWRSIPWDRSYLGFLVFFALACLVPLAVLHQHVWDSYTVTRAARMGKIDELQDIFEQLFFYWGLAILVVVVSLRWNNRSQPWLGVMYVSGGLSLLGKGLIGPGLVGVVVLVHMLVTGRLRLLWRSGLPWGIAVFVLASFPWHHAMVLYRGERFVNELIVMHNLARFGSGEQAQAVGSFAFYVETLGLAALPWVSIVPLAVWYGAQAFGPGAANERHPGELELRRFALLWTAVALWAITQSVTKYYHYLLPVLPPVGLLVGLWLTRVWSMPGRLRRSVVVSGGSLFGLGVLALVLRDVLLEPAWIAHLTTYLYVGMWREGAPEVDRLAWACAPFGVGLLLWVFGRLRQGVVAMVLSALLSTTYIIDDYLPAASESWSQRSAMQVYFDERGPEDRLVSWWFYYRGETFFTKRDVWVMKEPDRKKLRKLVKKYQEKGASLWFITTVAHGERLKSHLPRDVRGRLELAYESFHYQLYRLPLGKPS